MQQPSEKSSYARCTHFIGWCVIIVASIGTFGFFGAVGGIVLAGAHLFGPPNEYLGATGGFLFGTCVAFVLLLHFRLQSLESSDMGLPYIHKRLKHLELSCDIMDKRLKALESKLGMDPSTDPFSITPES
jgi:hypothetical protein